MAGPAHADAEGSPERGPPDPVAAVVAFVVAGILGAMVAGGLNIACGSVGGGPDAQPGLPADGVPVLAVVRTISASGPSRGIIRHRCRLDLSNVGDFSPLPSRETSVEVDLPLDVLPWFVVVPGREIVCVHSTAQPGVVVPAIEATRESATQGVSLPSVRCNGIPDQVYLKAAEMHIDQPTFTEAVVGCLKVDTSPHGTEHMTTVGLGLSGTDTNVVIASRLTVPQILALPLGTMVPVLVDPSRPKRVVIDHAGAAEPSPHPRRSQPRMHQTSASRR